MFLRNVQSGPAVAGSSKQLLRAVLPKPNVPQKTPNAPFWKTLFWITLGAFWRLGGEAFAEMLVMMAVLFGPVAKPVLCWMVTFGTPSSSWKTAAGAFTPAPKGTCESVA